MTMGSMGHGWRAALALTSALAVATTAGAAPAQGGGQPPVGAGLPPAQMGQPGQPGPRRANLERQVQKRIAQILKRELGLTDQQMTQLHETNRKFGERRRVLRDQ